MTEFQRLEEVSHFSRLSFPKLANAIGLRSPQTFYDIKSGKNKLSLDVASKIVEAFPSISIEWLLTGHGSMLKKESETIQVNSDGDNLNDSIKIMEGSAQSELIQIIKKRDEQIDRLLAIIEKMQE